MILIHSRIQPIIQFVKFSPGLCSHSSSPAACAAHSGSPYLYTLIVNFFIVLCCESEVSQRLPDFVVGYHGEEGPSVNLHVQTDHVACLEQIYSE